MNFKPFAAAALECAALLALQGGCWGQSRLEFDVASVRPAKGPGSGLITRTPGGLTARSTPLSRLVEMAFQTRSYDLSRVPGSLRSQRFDIVAKAAGKITGDQYWEMLRALLEDRFKLQCHRETKDAKVYALVLKGTGLGPNISRSENADCPVNPDTSSYCGTGARPGWIFGQRVSMARIAFELTPFAGRPVQDQTGLNGSFDFQLKWTPDDAAPTDGGTKPLNGPSLDSSGPSFATAIQEQLGLKLEPKKGQIELLVIDHAESPSEN